MTKEQLAEKFEKGWKHFCKCINFKDSFLDAEAIRFMNEVPGEILESLKDAKNV